MVAALASRASRTLQKTHVNEQFICYEASLSVLSESIRRRHDAVNPKKKKGFSPNHEYETALSAVLEM